MKLLAMRILCIGFVAWRLSGISNENRVLPAKMRQGKSDGSVAVYITKEKTFLILDGKGKGIKKVKSPNQFLRRISFISKKMQTENISIYSEETNTAISFFNELTEDSTIVKELDFQITNGELIIRTTLLEYPSRILFFRIIR